MTVQSESYPCRILKGQRIAIPKQIMQDLNLKVGDLLLRKRDKKALIFVPCKVIEIE
ncbi:MAG: hypothetical protein IIC67_05290 [Thaumarchaeota archaeon]|nr:hypothetical protein [Nitrososphaerota archaeon]